MPNMDGFEASEIIIKMMRDMKEANFCNIVALTSYTDQETRDRCLKIGLKDVMHKPLGANEL